MKLKLSSIFLALSLISTVAFAEGENVDSGKREENFAARKAEIINDLNAEKASIEKSIACVSSAAKVEDMKKCHEERKAAMDKMHQDRLARHRQHMDERKERMKEREQKMLEKEQKFGGKTE